MLSPRFGVSADLAMRMVSAFFFQAEDGIRAYKVTGVQTCALPISGVRGKNIWEHPESQRKAVMTRIAPGAKLPLHRHAGDELVFVIEGAISDEFGTITAGNVGYRPNGCVHTVSAPNGATVLAILTGGVEPLAQRASGPASQIFALSDLPWIEARPGVRQKRIWEDKTGSPLACPPPRRRRADLRRRRRQRGRIRPRGHRQHELPAERLRAHGHDHERRHRTQIGRAHD